MNRRGITLIELLISSTMIALVLVAGSFAYGAVIGYARRTDTVDPVVQREIAAQNRLQDLLAHVWIDDDTTDDASYFIASTGPASAAGGSESGGQPDTLTFTAAGLRVPGSYREETPDRTFEDLNEEYGPSGGVTEVSISTTPAGDAPSQTGLFLRTQTPADADPSQGGYEINLDPDIESVRFEFYDGTNWVSDWDTRLAQGRRVPSSVRVYYTLSGSSTEKSFVVGVPASDATSDNPVTEGA